MSPPRLPAASVYPVRDAMARLGTALGLLEGLIDGPHGQAPADVMASVRQLRPALVSGFEEVCARLREASRPPVAPYTSSPVQGTAAQEGPL